MNKMGRFRLGISPTRIIICHENTVSKPKDMGSGPIHQVILALIYGFNRGRILFSIMETDERSGFDY